MGQGPGEGEVIAKGADEEPVVRYSAIGPYTGVVGGPDTLLILYCVELWCAHNASLGTLG